MIARPRPRSRSSRCSASPFDAAILFSDILIVPFAIGQDLSFVAGEGPRLAPPLADASLDDLQPVLQRLEPIYETVARVKAALVARDDLPRLCRQPVDGRHLHGRRPGQPRAGRGAAPGLSRSRQIRRDHRPDRGGHGRLSVRPDRGRGRGGAIVRQLVGQPRPGRVRALGDRADRAASSTASGRAIPTSRSSAFPRAPAASLRAYARETGVDAIGLDETVDPAWAQPRTARPACRCRAISTRWR